MYTVKKGTEITWGVVKEYIEKHRQTVDRLDKLENYYKGEHAILSRAKINNEYNNKLVCNHAAEIVDNASSYFLGNPISYTGEVGDLLEWFEQSEVEDTDMELAFNLALYGRAYEYVCMSDEEVPIPESYSLEPQNTFVVYDSSIKHEPVFAVYYYPNFNSSGNVENYSVSVFTPTTEERYVTSTGFNIISKDEPKPNVFGMVNIVEYQNNKYSMGDFESVITLIDAYNTIQSDRVNDKAQFVDAILLIINMTLGEDNEERSETARAIRENKMLEVDENGDARYLTRTFDEAGVEILRKAIEKDIHKFSGVPCLTDENFASNASGVAMEYKLLGLENLCKVKERYFKKALKRRIELYNVILTIKAKVPATIYKVHFTRGMPKNLLELGQLVQYLKDFVSDETLLALLPFIENVDAELEAREEEVQSKASSGKDEFGVVLNE